MFTRIIDIAALYQSNTFSTEEEMSAIIHNQEEFDTLRGSISSNQTHHSDNMTYIYNPKAQSFWGDNIVIKEIKTEVRPGYRAITNNLYRNEETGKFAKKDIATNLRPIYEYESKLKEVETQMVTDEDTLTWQEQFNVSEDVNPYQFGKTIKELENLQEGTTVTITGIPVEMKRYFKDTTEGRKTEVRYFKIKDETGTIWVKPGIKVFMQVHREGQPEIPVTIKGRLIKMPKTIEKTYERKVGDKVFVHTRKETQIQMFLTDIRFVKFVPLDITGVTGNQQEITDQEFVASVLGGYVHGEVRCDNDYTKESGAWKSRMIQVIKPKPWLQYRETGLGDGVDTLLGNIENAEEKILKLLGQEVLDECYSLSKTMLSGDESEVPTYKLDGVWQYANAEVIGCIEEIEAMVFNDDRKTFVQKATERLEKHCEFFDNLDGMERERTKVIKNALQLMEKESIRIKMALKETKWDGERLVKTQFVSGEDWYNQTVRKLGEECVSQILSGFRKFGIVQLAGWIYKGVFNAAGMMMRNDVVPMRWKELQKARNRIVERSLGIKFYGGEASKALWSYFTSWQAIKRANLEAQEGKGNVDEGVDPQEARRQQIEAEAKEVRWLGWRYDRE